MIWLKLCLRGLGKIFASHSKEGAMPPINEFFIALVLGAFGLFSIVLAYGSLVAGGEQNANPRR